MNKSKVSRNGVAAGSADDVVARCQDMIAAAPENLDSLGDRGGTNEKLKALKQALKAYDAVRALPRNAIGAGAAATKALERLFPQVDQLLANQLDRLVWRFRESTPDFYHKYQTAHSIVSAATTSADEETPAVPLVNPATEAASGRQGSLQRQAVDDIWLAAWRERPACGVSASVCLLLKVIRNQGGCARLRKRDARATLDARQVSSCPLFCFLVCYKMPRQFQDIAPDCLGGVLDGLAARVPSRTRRSPKPGEVIRAAS